MNATILKFIIYDRDGLLRQVKQGIRMEWEYARGKKLRKAAGP